MEREEIVQAYQPFIETLRAGGFVEPENGWNAAQVAAHIVANNNGIAAVAEAIVKGERPSYDNTEVIDDAQLTRHGFRGRRPGEVGGARGDVRRAAGPGVGVTRTGRRRGRGPIADC